MNLGLYEPGKGYWTRVLTATGMGLLFLATAAWLWTQLALVPLPRPTWEMPFSRADGVVTPGTTVELRTDPSGTENIFPVIGAAVVRGVETRADGGGVIVVGDIRMDGDNDPSQTTRVTVSGAGAEAAPVFAAGVARAVGVPAFNPLYLQAGVAAALILVGFVITYWIAGVRKRSVEFLIATDGEMKKVNWSTKREIWGSTVVVLLAAVTIASFLFGVDQLFSKFFRLIGVLQM